MQERKCKIIGPKTWYLGIILRNRLTCKRTYKLYNRDFKNYSDVLYFIKINNRENNLAYYPIKGEDAIRYNFSFFRCAQLIRKIDRMLYYKYPLERDTKQARKSFRTKSRRWYRDYKLRVTQYNDFLSRREPKNKDK